MKATDYIKSGVQARGVTVPQAIELAYTIGERLRTKNLVALLKQGSDATLVATGQMITVTIADDIGNEGHDSLRHQNVEMPHHLIRTMFAAGTLQGAANELLRNLDEHLVDDFGIVIED